MLYEKDEANKLAMIWMTNEERQRYKDLLATRFAEIKVTGYKPVVFISGSRDLCEATADLLVHQIRSQK